MLSHLVLPVIPELKLTDKCLFDAAVFNPPSVCSLIFISLLMFCRCSTPFRLCFPLPNTDYPPWIRDRIVVGLDFSHGISAFQFVPTRLF
jgi:hypothetical protein